MASNYRMSFSTGGLFANESVQLARLNASLRDWDAVLKAALDQKLLSFRTDASNRRTTRELIARLRTLSAGEREALVDEDLQGQAALLWVAVCRLYPFIFEFMTELVADRYQTYRFELSYDDFDSFLRNKEEWHDELAALKETTRKKLRQILFRMMREAGVLSPDDRLASLVLSTRVRSVIEANNPRDLAVFPGPRG